VRSFHFKKERIRFFKSSLVCIDLSAKLRRSKKQGGMAQKGGKKEDRGMKVKEARFEPEVLLEIRMERFSPS